MEEMILRPFLNQVNAGGGSPNASQSNVPFPRMSISSFLGGDFESFHFGGTMEENVPIRYFLVKQEQLPQHDSHLTQFISKKRAPTICA